MPDLLATPAEVVASLGAVQAQDYLGALWSLGLRMRQATDDFVEQAFAEGSILRTHVLRPTWHFVVHSEIRWMQELTASRVKKLLAYMDRKLELDEALIARSGEVIANALQGGRQLTRAELGQALMVAGIAAEGQQLGQILMHNELDALVCSGPRRGKQFTYMLVEERAPHARHLSQEEALAELTQRYFTGHGPATVRDFAWWSGLTAAEVKAGLEMAKDSLECEEIEGQAYWFSDPVAAPDRLLDEAHLLPTYDEFLVGYASFDQSRKQGWDARQSRLLMAPILIGGRVAGSWRRTLKKGEVVIETAPFRELNAVEREAVAAAGKHYGNFLQLTASFNPEITTSRSQ